jgi:hypothetical protein
VRPQTKQGCSATNCRCSLSRIRRGSGKVNPALLMPPVEPAENTFGSDAPVEAGTTIEDASIAEAFGCEEDAAAARGPVSTKLISLLWNASFLTTVSFNDTSRL